MIISLSLALILIYTNTPILTPLILFTGVLDCAVLSELLDTIKKKKER